MLKQYTRWIIISLAISTLFLQLHPTFASVSESEYAGAWVPAGILPKPNGGFALGVYGNYVYIIGGEGSTDVYYGVIDSNGQIGNWQTGPSLSEGRSWSSQQEAVVYNQRIYVIGGSGTSSPQERSVVWYADINPDGSLGSWASTTSIPVQRTGHISALWNDKVYVWGGWTGYQWQSRVDYAEINSDGTLGAWSSAASLPQPRGHGQAGVAYDGVVYQFGGQYASGNYHSEVYYGVIESDGSISSWSLTTSMPLGRQWHDVAVLNGRVYMTGGYYSGPTWLDEVYSAPILSNGSIGHWVSESSLPTVMGGHRSFAYEGKLYVLGGYAPNQAGDEIYYLETGEEQEPDIVPESAQETDFIIDNNAYNFPNWGLADEGFSDLKEQVTGLLQLSVTEYNQFAPVLNMFYFISQIGGHCYGMASTSILYYTGELEIPYDGTVRDMPKEIAEPNINIYHVKQVVDPGYGEYKLQSLQYLLKLYLPNIDPETVIEDEWNKIKNSIDDGKPIMLLYDMHAVTVVGYEIINEELVTLYLYDNEDPDSYSAGTLDLEEHIFTLYTNEEYHFPYALEPSPYTMARDNTLLSVALTLLTDYLEDNGFIMISVACPVDTMIVDEAGNVIGVINGEEVNNIDGAYLLTSDDVELYFLPDEEDYYVEFSAFDSGTMDVNIISSVNGELVSTSYSGVEVEDQSVAVIEYLEGKPPSQMLIDMEAEGDMESVDGSIINVETGMELVFTNVKIYVKDNDGNPIIGASVTSTSQPSGQATLTGSTGVDGTASFSDVEPGSYEFLASSSTYVSGSGVLDASAGRTTEKTILLEKEKPQGFPAYVYAFVVVGGLVLLYLVRGKIKGS